MRIFYQFFYRNDKICYYNRIRLCEDLYKSTPKKYKLRFVMSLYRLYAIALRCCRLWSAAPQLLLRFICDRSASAAAVVVIIAAVVASASAATAEAVTVESEEDDEDEYDDPPVGSAEAR